MEGDRPGMNRGSEGLMKERGMGGGKREGWRE